MLRDILSSDSSKYPLGRGAIFVVPKQDFLPEHGREPLNETCAPLSGSIKETIVVLRISSQCRSHALWTRGRGRRRHRRSIAHATFSPRHNWHWTGTPPSEERPSSSDARRTDPCDPWRSADAAGVGDRLRGAKRT